MDIIIEDVFFLENVGRVSLAVAVNDPSEEIRPGWYLLIIDQNIVDRIWIDGEDFFYPSKASLRAVSTKNIEEIKKRRFEATKWKLQPAGDVDKEEL